MQLGFLKRYALYKSTIYLLILTYLFAYVGSETLPLFRALTAYVTANDL